MVSPCCSHVCYGTSQPFILGLGSGGEVKVGGGGVSKNRKTKSCTRKEKKLVHKEAWENLSTFMQVSPISGICITGMLERKSISESYSNEKC